MDFFTFVFALGFGLSVVAGVGWIGLKTLPDETKRLAERGIRDGVKQLGLRDRRLKPFGDWDERTRLSELGRAYFLVRITPFVSWTGPPLLIVGIVGMLVSK